MQVLEPLIFPLTEQQQRTLWHQLAAKRGDAKFIWVGELKTNFLFLALLGQDKQKNLFIQKREKRIWNSSLLPLYFSFPCFFKTFSSLGQTQTQMKCRDYFSIKCIQMYPMYFLYCSTFQTKPRRNWKDRKGIMALASGNCM